MHSIIVGFDGSQSAATALAWAKEEARLRGTRLLTWTALHQRPEAPVDEEGILAALRRTVAETADGSAVEFRFSHGGPAAELVAACTDADMLVVGSRGRNQLTGMLLGSVSRACLHHARCPVTVVPATPRPHRSRNRVIVGIDGSAHARHALRLAAEEAALRGAELHVIHVVYWDRLGTELLTPTPEQLLAWGRHLVATELAETGVDARPFILHGHTSDVLIRLSAAADLLVLGSRGHNPLTELLLGSTSDHCARHAACPVMVVRTAQPAR